MAAVARRRRRRSGDLRLPDAHLRHEETEALPLVQALLPAAGWERVEQAAGSGQRPLKLVFLVPWAADDLSPAQLETVLASLGGAFRVLLRLTRRPYERRARMAFRYA